MRLNEKLDINWLYNVQGTIPFVVQVFTLIS